MLMHRLTLGALLIAALIGIFWGDIAVSYGTRGFDHSPYWQFGSVLPLIILLLAVAGSLEALNLTRGAGYKPMGWPVVIGVVILQVLAWLIPARFSESNLFEWEMIVLVLVSMVIAITQVLRYQTQRGIGDISVSIMILVYMGVLPSFITALRTSLPGPTGSWAVLMFAAVVKGTDIGAYFTGMSIGRTKLIPSISPAKTVEGFVGGFLCAMVIAVVLGKYLPWASEMGRDPIMLWQWLVFGAAMAVLGQLGDLIESIYKRDASSKDSAKLIPAFGGILDLLDSPVFAAPVGYLLLHAWLR